MKFIYSFLESVEAKFKGIEDEMHDAFNDYEFQRDEYETELNHTKKFSMGELPNPRLVSDIDGPEEIITKIEPNENYRPSFNANKRLHLRNMNLAKSKFKWLYLKKELLLKKHWFVAWLVIVFDMENTSIIRVSDL